MQRKDFRMALGLAVAVLVSLFAMSQVRADEAHTNKKVTAPDAVMTAFHKAYPEAKILDVSKETKDSTVYYEIESKDKSTRRDLLYTADGKVFEMEEAISKDDLPAKVSAGLKAKFPGCKLQKAERITRGSTVEYEVLIQNNEQNKEVLLDANGTVKSQASVKDNDEESDSGKGDEADED